MEKKLVIMAGLPGSGKSYIRAKKYSDIPVIDCDELKKSIPGYDPKNPSAVHEQSKIIEAQEIYKKFGNGESFVYDTTATNFAKLIKMINDAHAIGYKVELCYVKVSLKTSLLRNSQRERVVPESIIMEKASLLPVALDVLASYVDNYVVVNND